MLRRQFINATAAGSAALIGSGTPGVLAGSRGPLVFDGKPVLASADARRKYVRALLEELCTGIGPRPVGTDAARRGQEVFARELRRSFDEVGIQQFTIEGWDIDTPVLLDIGGEPVEAFMGIGTRGTASSGIEGILAETGSDQTPFVIVPRAGGDPLAYVAVWDGSARARSSKMFGRDWGTEPLVIIGRYDREHLTDATARKRPAALRSDARLIPDAPCANVIATIPGQTSEEILFIAHTDTVYSSPGANDNTASALLLLLLAHELAGTTPRQTLTFLFSDGEEIGYHGAQHFVEQRRLAGTLDRIVYSFNFDSITWGPHLTIQTTDEGIRSAFASIEQELALPGRLQPVDRDGGTLDNTPLRGTGAVCVYVGSGGSDVHGFCWHRPNDIPENVPLDSVETTYLIFREAVRQYVGV